MVAECPYCRIAYQSPRPSPEASLAYMDWRWRSSDDYVGNQNVQLERARRQLGYVSRFTDKPLRLVDFGAGSGSFVRAALDQGWDATGIELSASARARAKEFYNVELREELVEGQYDVATLWDVVEHLRDPREVLGRIRNHLAREGLLFIETGNFENWIRVLEQDRWGLYLFDHQFYFSPTSLKHVLQQAGYNGFRLLPGKRLYPPARREAIAQRPAWAARAWFEWVLARMKWPAHGDINLMVAVARSEPGRPLPFRRPGGAV